MLRPWGCEGADSPLSSSSNGSTLEPADLREATVFILPVLRGDIAPPMDSLTKFEPWHRRSFAFQTLVPRLPIFAHTVSIEQNSNVLKYPWGDIVVTWSFRSRMGFEGDIYRARLAFHGLDATLDESI